MLAFLSEMYWCAALFFSVLFGWQLLATLFGHVGGSEHADMASGGHNVAGGHDVQETAVHGSDTIASFKLISVRSVTAFGFLFGWAGVMYMRKSPASPTTSSCSTASSGGPWAC